MRKLILGILLISGVFGSSKAVAGGGGGGAEGDEISMVVLDDLFAKAGKQWKTTSEVVWDEYSAGDLTVKATTPNGSSFLLHSDSRGDLTLKLDGEAQATRSSDDAAVAKMREALLLDTEELTDNEGGSEE
jgi:hypothetical protein